MRISTIIIIWVIALLSLNKAWGQNRVTNAKTGIGVPYVNIGVLHKGIGTVADADGYYSLNLTDALAGDTVKFSSIGYVDYLITVANLLQLQGLVSLEPKTLNIGEVVVKPKALKKMQLGIKAEGDGVTGGFISNDLGSELATVLEYTKKKPAQIKRVYISVAQCTYDSLFFRLNIYNYADGVPGENLLTSPVFIKTAVKNGVIEVNLDSSDLIINQPVAVSIEWLKDMGQGSLFFSCKFFKGKSYARKTSQADWQKIPVGMGIWADIEYEK